MSEEILIDLLGYLGAVAVVGAYWLINSKYKVNLYYIHTFNFFGAIALGINSYYHGAIPAVVINTVWIFIALSSFIKHYKNT